MLFLEVDIKFLSTPIISKKLLPREKQLKGLKIEKKEALINSMNPNWNFYRLNDL
ncbi:MAG: hypothetical protein N4A49_07170 [Marinifilaceae bacterium]|jgi:predicted GIY-YIG superfamily endonuclease|nr:hypothetical protein [Marinifilaceae bacterium]